MIMCLLVNVDAGVDLGKLRGLVVATPTYLHFDSVRQALEYKVPVFCEKPLTTRLSQAEPSRAMLSVCITSPFKNDERNFPIGFGLIVIVSRPDLRHHLP